MPILNRTALLVVLVAFGLSLAGCGTVRGVGDDLQGAGRALKRAAS